MGKKNKTRKPHWEVSMRKTLWPVRAARGLSSDVFILCLRKAADTECLHGVTRDTQTWKFLDISAALFSPSCLPGHANMPSRATEDTHSSLGSGACLSAHTAELPGSAENYLLCGGRRPCRCPLTRGAKWCWKLLYEPRRVGERVCSCTFARILSRAFCVGAIGGFCNPARFSLQMGQHPESMGGRGL